MIVSLTELTGAINKVKSFAGLVKNSPSVMLEFEEGKLNICYSDGKASIIEELTGTMEDGDIQGKVITDLRVFCENLDVCQPAAKLKTGTFHISIDGSDLINFNTYKYYDRIMLDEYGDILYNEDEDGNEVAETAERPVSTVSQSVKYTLVDASQRTAIISRMDYKGIFDGELWDEWNTANLKNVLTKLCKDEAKTCFLSKSMQAGFVVNLSWVTYITCDSIKEFGFTATGKIAKCLCDILGKSKAEKVYLSVVDNRYCRIISDDNSLGIQFEIAPIRKTDIYQLNTFMDGEYEDGKLAFNRGALSDIVGSALNIDNNNETVMTFKLSEKEMTANLKRGSASYSKSDMSMIAEDFQDPKGNLETLELNLNLKTVKGLLDNCEGELVILEIAVVEGAKYIRLTDNTIEDGQGKVLSVQYMSCK